MMQKSAIVTGANSFVGQAVVKELLQEGYYVCAFSHTGEISGVNKCEQLEILHFELNEVVNYPPVYLKDGTPYKYFFHFAWEGAVGQARLDSNLQLKNAQRTVECLKYAVRCGCECFVGSGTIMELEILELLKLFKPIEPVYNYGLGKLTAHGFCQTEATKLGIRFIWPIITNIYGPGEKNERFITWATKNLLMNNSIDVTECLQNYDFIYINDAAQAFRMLAENGISGKHYVVGSGNAQPIKNYLIELKKCVNKSGVINFGKKTFYGVFLAEEVFDTNNLFKDTGFCCSTEFSKGCKELIKWLVEKEGR